MKKLTYLISSLLLVGSLSYGATVSKTIPVAGFTNLLTAPLSGSTKITQIIVTATTTNNAYVTLVDTPTNSLVYTNPSYVTWGSYQTNYITTYTNYYGVTNAFTNIAMVDYYITNAASTNPYPVRVTASALTNTSSIFDGVNYYFVNGVWATNTGVGAATVTITYQQ